MNTAKAPYEVIGEALVTQYFNTFDSNRELLLPLYAVSIAIAYLFGSANVAAADQCCPRGIRCTAVSSAELVFFTNACNLRDYYQISGEIE